MQLVNHQTPRLHLQTNMAGGFNVILHSRSVMTVVMRTWLVYRQQTAAQTHHQVQAVEVTQSAVIETVSIKL